MSIGVLPTMEPHSESTSPDAERDSQTSPPNEPTGRPNEPTGPDAFNEAVRQVAEAREDFVYLLGVEFDRLKLKFRRFVIVAAVAIAALIVLLAVLVSATALLLWGLADLIGGAFGGRTWVGALIVGGGILLLAVGGTYGGIWGWNRAAFRAAKRRYEARKRKQREKFGHSVDPRDDRAG
jgi:hypothetical protein